MKKAIIDFTGCKYFHELHQRIQKALDFPDYYGGNLDAFWDCINRDCDVNFVTIVGCETLSEELKQMVGKMIDLLEENKQYWSNSDCPFDYKVIS